MRRAILSTAVMVAAVVVASATAYATHSWGSYHWARQSDPFTLKLGDNVNSTWDPILATTSSDWSKSTMLDTQIVTGGTNPKRCRPTSGRDEVCDSTYGNNGWLGLAQIWVTGGHITQGITKLNDTYFNTSTYNTTAWRNLVSCQEVGHTFGLDHQDENFDNANLGTCMDYTRDPGTNQHPNQGDYDELLCIYDPATNGKTLSTTTHSCKGTGHLDSTTTVGANVASKVPSGDLNNPSAWGRLIRESADGREAVFERDLGPSADPAHRGEREKMITFVRYTEEEAAKHKKA